MRAWFVAVLETVPRAALVRSTRAPPRTAPVLSVTLPEMVPPAVCPGTDTAEGTINRIATERFFDMTSRADRAPR